MEQIELARAQITGVDVFRSGSPVAEQEEARRLALEEALAVKTPTEKAHGFTSEADK